jgi:hypothetical protein
MTLTEAQNQLRLTVPPKDSLCMPGDGQNYNSTTTVTKPSTAGVQSIVQYSAKGATSELNATG